MPSTRSITVNKTDEVSPTVELPWDRGSRDVEGQREITM